MKNNLYETDFYTWVQKQILLLKSGNFEMADIDRIIEEIEEMGNKHADAIESYFVVILTHLIKWKFQPENRSGSWKGSITNGRTRIKRILKKNPGLKSKMNDLYEDTYEDAIQIASAETDISLSTFPSKNPWTKEEVLDLNFWPN